MNLAWKDIRFNRSRYLLTACGVGAIICATIGMIALYRGIVHEALLVIYESDADLWVVQANSHGPFAEVSRIFGTLDRRVEGVSGVRRVRRFLQFNRQFTFNNARSGFSINGLDFPKDDGMWVPLLAGRHLTKGHYETIVDISTGMVVGDVIRLGRDDFTVVGLTSGQVDASGDGILFVTVADAMDIDLYAPTEIILLSRATKTRPTAPLPGRSLSAVLVSVNSSDDIAAVKSSIERWGDVSVFTQDEEVGLVLSGALYKLRIQLLSFVFLMLVVNFAVISLAVYASVLEKLHAIALLKLMGARSRVVILMIVQYSLLIGVFGSLFAVATSVTIFPWFPRTVLMLPQDIAALIGAVVFVCVFASWFGVSRALKVRAQEVLA